MISNTSDPHSLHELHKRQHIASQQGGSEKISKQHQANRLTARERISKLLDKNSFFEQGQLAISDLKEVKNKTPADGKICGFGEIEGKQIAVTADDATVLAGSGGRIGYEKEFKTHLFAQQKGFPSIHLGDGGGARVPDIMGATGMMTFTYDVLSEPRNRQSPLITAIMGECYGGPTWKASVSDIVIQVKGAIMAVSGPSVLEIATTEKVTAEELGGWQTHAQKTGLVDLFAENDLDCLKLVRKVLSYLPQNHLEKPSVNTLTYFSNLKNNKLLDIIPRDERYSYDMHDLLKLIVDQDSMLELKPYYDGSLITTLARLNGQVVGILANNPKVTAGAMGWGACEKAVSFITLCDSYHIPLIFIHDTPGFYVSKAAEEHKMPVKIMNFIKALQYASVPKISLIVRKSYGMAHCNMLGANMGADFLLAWPKAEISFMAPKVAANVVLGRKILQSDNPQPIIDSFMAEMQKMNAPWEAAERNFIDRIIDPRDTRQELIKCLKFAIGQKPNGGMSQRKLASWIKV